MTQKVVPYTMGGLALIAVLSLGILLSFQHKPNGRNEEAGPGALYSAEGTIHEKRDTLDGHCVMNIELSDDIAPSDGQEDTVTVAFSYRYAGSEALNELKAGDLVAFTYLPTPNDAGELAGMRVSLKEPPQV
ncbi:hypothetical protein [Collinsella phocaeensis]|jgi:hypothetical protein|uniref:hypothetical protein n=1 Tax=Collinsella phocaeensis TaxID=1871016 RepID=UPI00093046F3|nr:hypothetical protein [Collinsella phocaeensis]